MFGLCGGFPSVLGCEPPIWSFPFLYPESEDAQAANGEDRKCPLLDYAGSFGDPGSARVLTGNFGGIPKRPTGADCKSAGLRLRWFESTSLHQFYELQDSFAEVDEN